MVESSILGSEKSRIFMDVLSELHRHSTEESVYQFVLEQLVKSLRAQAGTFFLAESKMANLVPVASVGVPIEKLKGLPFKYGLGVCGTVAETCESLILNDVNQDKRFNSLYDQSTGFVTKSILCAPLQIREECLGVIELINQTDGKFSPEDLVLLNMLGKHMAVALDNILRYKSKGLAEAFNANLLNLLPAGLLAFDKNGTVIFCNKRAFEILVFKKSRILGEKIEDIFREQPVFNDILQSLLKENKLAIRGEVELPRYAGKIRLGYSTFFVDDAKKERLGYAIIFQNITYFQK